MKFSTFLNLSVVILSLLIARPAAGEGLLLESGIYVFKTSDFRSIEIPGATAAALTGGVVFKSPSTFKFDQAALRLDGTHFFWNNDGKPPPQFSTVNTPIVPLAAGQPTALMYSTLTQYLERLPDGKLRVREIPQDSPDGPRCQIIVTMTRAGDADQDVLVKCELDIATVTSRESIPGVALGVGKPIIARLKDDVKFTAHVGDWAALFLKGPNGSDYSTLFLLKVTSAQEQQKALSKVADFHLKKGRFAAAVVAQANYLYVIGGQTPGGILGDIERFDVRTHEIKVLTEKLTPRHHHGAALVDGKIYILGGEGYGLPDSTPLEPTTEIYDLESGTITQGPSMPMPRSNFATAALGHEIYTIGGIYGQPHPLGVTGRTEIYNTVTNSWSDGVAMPSPRDTRAAAVIGDIIVVAGGHRPPLISTGTKTVEYFNAERNWWVRLPDLDKNVSANSAAVLENHLFLFGNYDPADEIMAYDLTAHTSTIIKNQLKSAGQATAIALDGLIYVIGGTGGGGRRRSDRDAMDNIQVFALLPIAGH